MNSKEVRYVVAIWLNKEKRSSLAEDHLKLFDFLATVNNETLNDLPKIVNIFKEMKEDQELQELKPLYVVIVEKSLSLAKEDILAILRETSVGTAGMFRVKS